MRSFRLIAIVVGGLFLVTPAYSTGRVVDGHYHQGITVAKGALRFDDLDALRNRGFDVVVQVLPIDPSRTDDVLGRLEIETRAIRSAARDSAELYLPDDPETLMRDSRPPGTGVFFSMEWFGPTFEGDASRAFRLRELGIRIVGLPDADPDGLFLTGEEHDQLSPFGRKVISSLNEAGVLIDLTHLDHGRKLAVIAASAAPTVVSHGNVAAAADIPFNLPDAVVDALAASGGFVWVSFNRNGVLADGEEQSEAVSRLIDHIQRLAKRLGPDKVGVGTDLQADGRYVPPALYRPDTIERLWRGLGERGFTSDDVDGFLGGNVLRALASASKPNR